jgi:hypothetical protein
MVAETLIVSVEITRLKGRRRNIASSFVPHRSDQNRTAEEVYWDHERDCCESKPKIPDHEIRCVRRFGGQKTTIEKGMLEARTTVAPRVRGVARNLGPFAHRSAQAAMSITRPAAANGARKLAMSTL